MSPNDITTLAKRIAEEEIGGPPARCTGHKADRYNAAYNAVVKALAALSPQGLDAKGLRTLLQSLADAPHASYPGQLVRHVYASDCPTCIASHLLRQWPHAAPSQRLDAATVERCAQVADAFREQAEELSRREGAADARAMASLAGEEVAARIRTLATEPHQHGGSDG